MDVKELDAVFRYLETCCLHQPQWRPLDVESVLAGVQHSYGGDWEPVTVEDGDGYVSWKNGTDSESAFAVRLKDGGYGLLCEGEDYTGHGCQCSAFTGRYGTLAELLAASTPDYGPELTKALQEKISNA
jgi:hypothetical protein